MFICKKFILDNGLKVLFSPMNGTKVVTVNLFVKCGSRYENSVNNGVTHFIEHMLFKGTDSRKDAFSISKEVDSMGADINGATSHEYAYFYIKALKDHFEKALDILSDIIMNSKFEKKDMAVEKNTIIEEISMRKDNTGSYVWELYNTLLYGSQPLGFPISGSEAVIKKLSRNEVTGCWKKYFTGKNIIISIAGDMAFEKTFLLVKKYFSGIASGRESGFRKISQDQKKPAILKYEKATEQVYLCLGNRTFNYTHPDFSVMEIINGILGMTMSSRLFVILRETKGLVYSVSTSNDFFSDTGNFSVYAGVNEKNLQKTLKIVLSEFYRIKTEKTGTEELDRIKKSMEGYLYMVLDSSSGMSNYTGRQELHRGEVQSPVERMALLNKVTADDIIRVSRNIFKKETLNLALAGPVKEENSILELMEEFR